MRKGLIAIVVLAALGALALMFWPREVERDPDMPAADNAAVNAPGNPERTDAAGTPARQASPLAAAPSSGAATAAPGVSAPGAPPQAGRDGRPPAPGSPEGLAAGPNAAAGGRPLSEPQLPARQDNGAPAPPSGVDAAGSAGPQPPVFDLVRVSPDGQAVIAGRAGPGQTVDILLDGELLGSAEADATGAFVTVAEAPPSTEPRELVLRVARSQGAGTAVRSDGPVSGGERVASLGPGAGTTGGDHLFSAPVIVLPSGDTTDAPVLVSPGQDELELVQPAMAEADRMALDRISYEAGGDVVAAGRGPDASAVRAYANGELIAEAPVGEDGAWQAVIPWQVAQNTELLRFDEVSAGGDVMRRLEAPFSYASEGASQELQKRDISIERGQSLWRIAEQHYGEGLRYSVIYSANAELIRDPDLIYPGQVFAVPKLVATE